MTLCTVTSPPYSRLHTYRDTCTLCFFFLFFFFTPPSVSHVAIPPSGDQTKWGFSGGMIYLLNGRIRIWEPPFFTCRWHHLPKSRKKTAAHPDSKHSSYLFLHPDLLYNLFFYTKLFVINTCILWVRVQKPGEGTKQRTHTQKQMLCSTTVPDFFLLMVDWRMQDTKNDNRFSYRSFILFITHMHAYNFLLLSEVTYWNITGTYQLGFTMQPHPGNLFPFVFVVFFIQICTYILFMLL